MTHFTVGIIVPPTIRRIETYIARQMAPYNENRRSPGNPANPDGRFDWYRVGGRWDGWIIDNEPSSGDGFNFSSQHESIENNVARTEDALTKGKIPHAIITPDREWHERGEMGWFAVMSKEREDWDDLARDILRKHPGHRIVILDAHI